LKELVASDPGREQDCLQDTPLKELVTCGGKTGLSDFLREVYGKLLPLFDPVPVRPCNTSEAV